MAQARRWAVRGVAAVLLQAALCAAGCSRPASTLALDLTGVAFGAPRPLAEGADIASGLDEVRISGASTVECRLLVFTLARSGEIRRLLPAGDPEVGDVVGPGPFRLRGGLSFDKGDAHLRIFGVCGGPDLRFAAVAAAVRAAYAEAGAGDEAVVKVARVPGLPEEIAQVSALYRTR